MKGKEERDQGEGGRLRKRMGRKGMMKIRRRWVM